ncbi:MAG: hypothetical protein H7A23_03775 [Leptospiraceae bacterium]|nr:hypothetical protein [Leptospiraceae bacterium]MCP5493650.1 hypothetical protein [Leptospiraceae bacterium]
MESFKPKPILNRSELKQIKKSRTKLEGKKIITDDVKKLKSLKVAPDLSIEEMVNYYKEPIWIEYYIPKESRFALEIKYLFIKLIEPVPRDTDNLLKDAMEQNDFLDIWKVKDKKKEYEELIKRSYINTFPMWENISEHINQFKNTNNAELLRTPVYLYETLMQFEPSLATLELLGEHLIYNMNWLIKKLNQANVDFSLEDYTTSILIKRRNIYWEENKLENDEDFEIMSTLFFEQAFPHRGAEELDEADFLLD